MSHAVFPSVISIIFVFKFRVYFTYVLSRVFSHVDTKKRGSSPAACGLIPLINSLIPLRPVSHMHMTCHALFCSNRALTRFLIVEAAQIVGDNDDKKIELKKLNCE